MTDYDAILAKVRTIITEVIEVKSEDIQMTASLRDDLHADSLASVEIVMALEDAFGIFIDEAKAASMRTVSDLVEAISMARQGAEASET